ncbi:MAG: hypothetical protein PS018_11645 [bacterium]|nr:hypothetical protein [bacterium]
MHGKPCPYCNGKMAVSKNHARPPLNIPTRDHLNPRVNGGGPTIICCRRCNGNKSDHPLREWRDFLRRHNDYRWKTVSALVDQLDAGTLRVVGGLTPSGFDVGVFA